MLLFLLILRCGTFNGKCLPTWTECSAAARAGRATPSASRGHSAPPCSKQNCKEVFGCTQVRGVALALHIFHTVDKVERLTELEADAGVWKRPASHISDQLRASRRAADHKAVVKCPAIGHDALAGGADPAVLSEEESSAVFQQLSRNSS